MINIKNPKFVVFAVIAAIIIALYFLAVPQLINIERHRPQIEKSLEKRINLPSTLGRMDTSLTWNLGIRVYFKNINIRHSNMNPFISTGRLYVEISLPSLLRNKVVIREIKVADPVLHIVRLSDGRFDIE